MTGYLMSTNYNDLITAIKSYSGRTDAATTKAIPGFIAQAQSKLDGVLRIAEMMQTVNFAKDKTTVSPISLLQIDSVIIGEFEGHLTTFADVLAQRKLAAARLPVLPTLYTQNGTALELVLPSDVTVSGFKKPPRLSSSVPTNAYTDAAENALLFYSLTYLGVYSRDSDGAKSWQAMADQEVDILNEAYHAYSQAGNIEAVNNGYF